MRSFNKITSIGLFAFLDSLVCVLASEKKFTKNFAGESTEKAIYKMAAITECEILLSVHPSFQHAIIKLLVSTLLCSV